MLKKQNMNNKRCVFFIFGGRSDIGQTHLSGRVEPEDKDYEVKAAQIVPLEVTVHHTSSHARGKI